MIPPESKQDQIIFNFISSDSILEEPNLIQQWIVNTIVEEKKSLAQISYIFCDDAYLLDINKKYLEHDDYTDIITFPYGVDPIDSDIFISLERVDENAQTLGVDYLTELHRVMVHGVLHLCGYADKSKEEKVMMREKEDYYLLKRNTRSKG